MSKHFFLLIATFALYTISYSQDYLFSKEGKPILNRREFLRNCLKSFNKNQSDKTALAICECQASKIDRHFTNRQFKNHTTNNTIDLTGLFLEDSLLKKEIDGCFTNSGHTALLQAEGFEIGFVAGCIRALKKSSAKTLDQIRVTNFCNCQLQMVKSKKLSDAELQTLSNPNSLLFYEMIYKCGDPFLTENDTDRSWKPNAHADVEGPSADTISILNLQGMSYVKIKIGGNTQVWLFDTGASDLLIDKATEEDLKKQQVLNDLNYLGVGQYEMANGTTDSCRRYRVNNVKIGRFSVDNVLLSVSDKAKRIIAGRSLMNKFKHWRLNNAENTLILATQ